MFTKYSLFFNRPVFRSIRMAYTFWHILAERTYLDSFLDENWCNSLTLNLKAKVNVSSSDIKN